LVNNPFNHRPIIESQGRSHFMRIGDRHGLDQPKAKGDTTMLTKSKIALSLALALALGTASVATAAPKHAIHHRTTIHRQVPASAYRSLGAVRPAPSVQEPAYMRYQDQGIRNYL
jgi:hypothetical protein